MYAQSSLVTFIKCMKTHTNSSSCNTSSIQKGGSHLALTGLANVKLWFLLYVFCTLIFQLLLTFGVVTHFSANSYVVERVKRLYWFIFVLQLGIITYLVIVPMHPIIKFLLLSIFAILTGFALLVIANKFPQSIINSILLGTIAIFTVFVIFGIILFSLGINLGWMGYILLFLLIALIIVRIVESYMIDSSNLHRTLAGFSLMLFSLFIMYDTNKILLREYNGDFVTAALDYFLDILNVFLSIMNFSKM
jgi:FtsH-binding integral membrane protein